MIDIHVGTSRSGFHRWPNAPPHRAYLGLRHQHTFAFEVTITVEKADRDIEFHDAREKLECIVEGMFPDGEFGDKSCEMIAIEILNAMPEARSARVGEDPQHFAIVSRDGVSHLDTTSGGMHVTTVCGSTKFKEETRQALMELEDEGLAAFSVGGFSHADRPYPPAAKARYDALHKYKIKISDSIYVVNPEGYIGQSTAGEILLAWSLGIPVRYRYPQFEVRRGPIEAFYERMGRKLLLNAHKGGWQGETIQYVIEGIERELEEVKKAIREGQSRERIADEFADIGNYSLMGADKCMDSSQGWDK